MEEKESTFTEIYKDLKEISKEDLFYSFSGKWRDIDKLKKKDSPVRSFGEVYAEYYFPNAKYGEVGFGHLMVNDSNNLLLWLQEEGNEGRDTPIKLITNDSSFVEENKLGWKDMNLHSFFSYVQ